MKKIFLLFIVFSLSTTIFGATKIKVGAYDFPPFVNWQAGIPQGVVVELVKKLNESQQKYQFQLMETSANRRYEDLQNKIYDIIFFENIQWGWAKLPVRASKVFLIGGEVFITKQTGTKKQNYFENLADKTIRGILGYHYGFTDFSTDPEHLKKWKLELTNSHEGNILAILEDRASLAIVTKEYLDIYLKMHPEAKKNLLISTKMDQIYQHSAIVRNGSPISVKELNDLQDKLKKDNFFQKLMDLKSN